MRLQRGAHTVCVVSIRQKVRMYTVTPDLVKSLGLPASERYAVMHAPNAFARTCDWERVALPTLNLAPRHADIFIPLMDGYIGSQHLVYIAFDTCSFLRPQASGSTIVG